MYGIVQLNAYKNRFTRRERESGTRGLARAAYANFNESGLFMTYLVYFARIADRDCCIGILGNRYLVSDENVWRKEGSTSRGDSSMKVPLFMTRAFPIGLIVNCLSGFCLVA